MTVESTRLLWEEIAGLEQALRRLGHCHDAPCMCSAHERARGRRPEGSILARRPGPEFADR